LFPSLHDEAGWVLAEALAAMLPAVCLDHGGPPLLSDGFAIVVAPTGGRASVTTRLAGALERARVMPMEGASDLADYYLIDRRSQMLPSLVEPLLAGGHATAIPDSARSPLDRNAAMSVDQREVGE
jgi:glycosyltransferase involved in cell wall biosynthesis